MNYSVNVRVIDSTLLLQLISDNSSSTSKRHVCRNLYPDEYCESSDIPFPSVAGATSTPITTCSGKESVDMDSSTEQITSERLMAMFSKTPVTSKEHKKKPIHQGKLLQI